MIDIKKAEEEFKKYASKYDMSESHIERKVRHTFRVEELCEKISISLKMNEEDINLAKLIGILHDIARFEQYTIYKTYNDLKSIDHGDFAVEILKKDNYIRKYIETNEYDEIILKAIKNHNKYQTETNLSQREATFCKIIRDADKLDILYQATCETWKDDMQKIESQIITQEVIRDFSSKSTINRINVKEIIDRIVVHVAFIYDLNFEESFKILKENNYINKIFDRFNFEKEETRIQMEKIQKVANDYINDQIKEN